jgi:hypothetical protein
MISPGSRIAHFLDDSTYGLAVGDIFLADRQIDIIARHRIIFLLSSNPWHGSNRVEKIRLQADQKIQRRGARKIDERRRTWLVRCSEAIERNEAYGTFSAAC